MKLPLRVDLEMKLAEAARAMGANLTAASPLSCSGVALDTRALRKGDLFFALRATRDGHDFVRQAFELGAAAAVVEKELPGTGPTIRVSDTFQALGLLANSVRRDWGGKIVAISGSNGKTTTKEMASALIGADRPTLKAPGTWNNQLGVPLTLLMLRPERKTAVLEMGMNAYGELRALGRVAAHDVALLTNIGPAHLEKFGSLEGVARAKAELFEGLGAGGVAVVNLDDRYLRKMGETVSARAVSVSMGETGDVTAKILQDLGPGGYRLRVRYGGEEIDLESPFVGVHNVSNLLCALGAAFALGVPAGKLAEGVKRIERVEMRLEVIELGQGIRIVNDCYNANPASVAVALEVTKNTGGRRVLAALGDMMELGEFSPRAHRDIGIKVAALKYVHLFLLGQFAGDLRQGAIQGGMSASAVTVGTTHQELAERIAGELTPGDTLLVKGSRGMRMEEITKILQERFKENRES
jgi:UDP-N-acetylmuramoyl-tripeptide--D-alanyl-D-alanine ligase